jgi:CheY-like chemotaxis protein
VNAWNILVVDDSEANRDIISEILDDSHYRLTMTGDGIEAWNALIRQDQSFDLIVLDRMMPVMDGMQLLKKIKADERFATISVIMQTAASSPEQIREGLAAGCYFYLTKPFKGQALVCIINAALEELRSRKLLSDALATLPPVPVTSNAEYPFATLEEATRLSALLASQCPEPMLAALGLAELLTNAVEHGNLGISYAEKSQLKREDRWEDEILERLNRTPYRERRAVARFVRTREAVIFTIIDQGAGFEWQKFLDFDPDRAFDPNGRGIALAKQSAFAKLDYQGTGNHVVAEVRLA